MAAREREAQGVRAISERGWGPAREEKTRIVLMPTFAYSGRTRTGQTVSGERAADSMDSAVAALRREQILVTRITPAKTKEEAAKKEQTGKIGKKVKAKNLAVFTRQFSVMIDAGLPL